MKQKYSANSGSVAFGCLVILGIVTAIVLFIMLIASLNTRPGDGKKIGQIVKVSKEGIFNQTWEAQLLRGGLTSGSGAVGTSPFDFTIPDAAQAAQVQKAMESQTEVVITYHTKGFYSPFSSGSDGDFLVSIKSAKEVAKAVIEVPVPTPAVQE